MELGLLGVASDIRDRRQDPALRNRLSARSLDPRLHRPVFIIGAPRSGTTFLGNSLGRLPEISYHFEPRLTKAAARCVEKNPENSFLVPFLATEFPGAQFVHIVRDGRDAAVSHAEQPWLSAAAAASGQRGRGGQLHGPHARWWVEPARREEFAQVTDIVRSAWCWRRFTESARDGVGGLPAGRTVEVRYETMVSEPAGTADQLADGLELSAASRDALHAGLSRARPDSVGRWRKSLAGSDLIDVLAEIEPLLARLGYV
jgi:hypothetical protein